MTPDLPSSVLLVVVGLVGVVLPVIPGLLLTLAGILLWAWELHRPLGWVVLGVCMLLYAAGGIIKVVVPGRRLRAQGVGTGALAVAVAVGVVGFFVVPVLGAALGFVLVLYLREHARTRDGRRAWARTKQALRALMQSTGIELVSGLLIAAVFAGGVVLSR